MRWLALDPWRNSCIIIFLCWNKHYSLWNPHLHPTLPTLLDLVLLLQVQPSSMQPGYRWGGKHIHVVQQLLVCCWHSDAAGFRYQPESCVYPNCWGYLVVFHPHHNIILYCQLGSFPDSRADGVANWKCRRFSQTDQDRIWHHSRRIYNDVLFGKIGLITSRHLFHSYFQRTK